MVAGSNKVVMKLQFYKYYEVVVLYIINDNLLLTVKI